MKQSEPAWARQIHDENEAHTINLHETLRMFLLLTLRHNVRMVQVSHRILSKEYPQSPGAGHRGWRLSPLLV